VPLCTITATRLLPSAVTRFPYRSRIVTTGGVVNAVPLAPPTGCIVTTNCVASPAVPVAVNITGEPASPATVAVSVFAPAVVPKVQAGLVAMPSLSVLTALDDAIDPAPPVTAKVTPTPLTALPCASVTLTEGTVATAVPTVVLCRSPPFIPIRVATPEATVTVCDSTAVSAGSALNLST
jgi:hypothetical protein